MRRKGVRGMKFGIYYAYWEQEWRADYRRYVKKTAELGFDILEIAASPLPDYSDAQLYELRDMARAYGMTLTAGHGLAPDQNIASADPAVRENGRRFYLDLFRRLEKLDIHFIGGGLNGYWPVDYGAPIDKQGDWGRSVESLRALAGPAADCGVTLGIEVLNRFEGYLCNTAEEGVRFVKDVDAPNVKVMLDTFHMNIEETSMGGAIRTAGPLLGHFHVGECNRRVPGKGRMPWNEIAEALTDIGYDGNVVMEPFVRQGGQVGRDIKVWRPVDDGSEQALDRDAQASLQFLKYSLLRLR